jgi:hypothetical protein
MSASGADGWECISFSLAKAARLVVVVGETPISLRETEDCGNAG